MAYGPIMKGTSMPKYYIDSSENPSSDPADALDGPYEDLAKAQEIARKYAFSKPETEFYVNSVKTVTTQVYRATARMELETEVISDAAISE